LVFPHFKWHRDAISPGVIQVKRTHVHSVGFAAGSTLPEPVTIPIRIGNEQPDVFITLLAAYSSALAPLEVEAKGHQRLAT